MELTRQADYAVRIVLDLAARADHGVVRSDEVARRQLIPRAYFTKVVQELVRAGYLRTRRGANGGVQLLQDPASITLRQVIEAIEGPIYLNRCLVRSGECPLDRTCAVHPVWHHIQDVLTRELDAVTFAALAASRAASPRSHTTDRRKTS